MSHVFELYKKGKNEPISLVEIDKEICNHLGVEPDSEKYVYNWMDNLGAFLALGMPFNRILKIYTTDPLKDISFVHRLLTLSKEDQEKELQNRKNTDEVFTKIVIFLRKNYEVRAWREHGFATDKG